MLSKVVNAAKAFHEVTPWKKLGRSAAIWGGGGLAAYTASPFASEAIYSSIVGGKYDPSDPSFSQKANNILLPVTGVLGVGAVVGRLGLNTYRNYKNRTTNGWQSLNSINGTPTPMSQRVRELGTRAWKNKRSLVPSLPSLPSGDSAIGRLGRGMWKHRVGLGTAALATAVIGGVGALVGSEAVSTGRDILTATRMQTAYNKDMYDALSSMRGPGSVDNYVAPTYSSRRVGPNHLNTMGLTLAMNNKRHG